MSQVSQLNIYFVLPVEDKEAKCSADMDSAFNLVKRYRGKPVWVVPSFCLSHSPQYDDVFVFDEFKGEAFEKMKKDSAKILGARCMLTSLTAGDVIPQGTSPTFTEGMRGLIVSTTGFDAPNKKQIQERIEYMGGNYQSTLRSVVTHLVAYNNITPKAIEAAKAGKAVMTVEWVEAVWKKSKQTNVRGNDPEFNRYLSPLFNNLKFTTTGINKRKKDEIKELVNTNGGTFMGQMEMNVTDILVVEKPEGDKFKAAKSWGIKCVKSSWVRACVYSQQIVPLVDHLLEKPKASTPNKNDVNLTGNFSTISAIEVERDFSHVEESANITLSQSVMLPPPLTPGPAHIDTNTYLVDRILEKASQAGHFLDGCNILLYGFNSSHTDKLKRILNLGGATRYDELTPSVTHVVLSGSIPDSLMNIGAHILSLNWVFECAELRKPAPLEPYLMRKSSVARSTPASPLSKQGARLLSRDESVLPVEVAEIEPAVEDPLLHHYHLSQQGEPLEDRPVQNLIARPASLSSSARSDALTQTNTELFHGLKFFLSKDLNEDEFEGCVTTIDKYGGTVISRKFSGVPDFAVVPLAGASLAEVTALEVVNVLFIKDCIMENRMMPIQYYHQTFPWVKNSTPLKDCVACVTKYAGVERDFVELLIETIGGIAQDILAKKRKNDILQTTHLICTEPSGNKYEGAVRWGVPVVHHNWLLKCAELGVRVPEEPYLITENKALASTTKSTTLLPKATDSTSSLKSGVEILGRISDSTGNRADLQIQQPRASSAADQTRSPFSRLSQRTPEVASKTPLAVSRRLLDHDVSPVSTPALALPAKLGLFEATGSPVHKALERLRNKETPQGSTTSSPDMNRTVTPNTPLGACFGNENPSPGTRKRLYKWINQGANLDPDPPPKRVNRERRDSTPISELLSRQIRSMMRKPEDQPPDDSPEPAGKRLNFGISAEAESLANDVLNGLQKMKEIEDSYIRTNVVTPTPPSACEEPKLVMVTESQPHTEIGWEDPTDREVALASLERAVDHIVENPLKIFMLSGLTENVDLAKEIIEASGGKVSALQYFDTSATHLIAGPGLTRAEKLMGSLAAGLWILHPTYLTQLEQVKDVYALNEEDFEWGSPKRPFPLDSLKATVRDSVVIAHSWRRDIQILKKPPVFTGIAVMFRIAPSKMDTFKRLIEAGGGEITTLEGEKNGKKTYCICENGQITPNEMSNLAKRKIYCVTTMFISDMMLRKDTAVEDNVLPGFEDHWKRWQL